jgi:hypothetical protein
MFASRDVDYATAIFIKIRFLVLVNQVAKFHLLIKSKRILVTSTRYSADEIIQNHNIWVLVKPNTKLQMAKFHLLTESKPILVTSTRHPDDEI